MIVKEMINFWLSVCVCWTNQSVRDVCATFLLACDVQVLEHVMAVDGDRGVRVENTESRARSMRRFRLRD